MFMYAIFYALIGLVTGGAFYTYYKLDEEKLPWSRKTEHLYTPISVGLVLIWPLAWIYYTLLLLIRLISIIILLIYAIAEEIQKEIAEHLDTNDRKA